MSLSLRGKRQTLSSKISVYCHVEVLLVVLETPLNACSVLSYGLFRPVEGRTISGRVNRSC